MPKIDGNVRITVPVGDEDVVFICRRPDAQEVSKFLSSRFQTKRNKVTNRMYEARQAFLDTILLDVTNVEFEDAAGATQQLSAATVLTDADRAKWAGILHIPVDSVDWKALIPVNWKSSAAQYFEDAALGGEGD